MSITNTTKGDLVLDELRLFLAEYLKRDGAMSQSELGRRVGLSHVSIGNFLRGGRLYFDSAVLIAEAVGFDLSKSLKAVG